MGPLRAVIPNPTYHKVVVSSYQSSIAIVIFLTQQHVASQYVEFAERYVYCLSDDGFSAEMRHR